MPTGVRDLVGLELDQLASEDRQILLCASVRGVEFESAVIAKALRRDWPKSRSRCSGSKPRPLSYAPPERTSFRNRVLTTCYRNCGHDPFEVVGASRCRLR